MRWSKVLSALFLIVFGLVWVVITNPWGAGDRPYRGGVTTTATLGEVTTGKNNSNDAWYRGVYVFSGPDGARFTVEGLYEEKAESRVARRVEVSYPKGDPAGARVLPRFQWLPTIIAGVGVVIMFVGAFQLIGALLPRKT